MSHTVRALVRSRYLVAVFGIGLALGTPGLASPVRAADAAAPSSSTALLRFAVPAQRAGASVWIDGAAAATARASVEVAPGRHTVQFRDGSWSSSIKTVDVAAGDSVTVQLGSHEVPQVATLRIELGGALPPARLWIDGADRGVAGGSFELQPGDHQIAVVFADGSVLRRSLRVAAGDVATLRP